MTFTSARGQPGPRTQAMQETLPQSRNRTGAWAYSPRGRSTRRRWPNPGTAETTSFGGGCDSSSGASSGPPCDDLYPGGDWPYPLLCPSAIPEPLIRS